MAFFIGLSLAILGVLRWIREADECWAVCSSVQVHTWRSEVKIKTNCTRKSLEKFALAIGTYSIRWRRRRGAVLNFLFFSAHRTWLSSYMQLIFNLLHVMFQLLYTDVMYSLRRKVKYLPFVTKSIKIFGFCKHWIFLLLPKSNGELSLLTKYLWLKNNVRLKWFDLNYILL